MIEIKIPDYKTLKIEHLCLDYNGTLAFHGKLKEKVSEVLCELAQHLDIHVLTADTFGNVKEEMKDLPVEIVLIGKEEQAKGKLQFVENLGFDNSVSIGNGRNDAKMLKEAAIGIAIMQEEGAASVAILNANIVCNNILDALHLLLYPTRIIATLRS